MGELHKTGISKEERSRRQAAVDFARGSVRFEGIVLSEEIEAINRRYIAGEITSEEHTALIKTTVASKIAALDGQALGD